MTVAPDLRPPTLKELTGYFLNLGATGFGGPIALCGYMQRDLVEKRRWFSEEDYAHGLALAQLAPGPLAAQLAMYLGWAHSGMLGAAAIGVAFVLPSFVMVLALSYAYVNAGGLSWMQGAFHGIGAAVIAIIARSAFKLARTTLKRDWALWTIFVVNAAATVWTQSEVVWIVVVSGAAMVLLRRPAGTAGASFSVVPFLLTGIHGPATPETLVDIAWFFAKAGAFVFGSGLAIVPFLYGGVVTDFHWLDERQFLDAVAVAMITPGPVVITVVFVGYLAAGIAGGVTAAVGIFLPCYLFTVIPARYFRRYISHPDVKTFVDGVTAAAIGAIAGAGAVLAQRALTDVLAAMIALAAGVLMWRTKKIPEPVIVLTAGIVGMMAVR